MHVCACMWSMRVGTESGEELENFTRLKPALIRKALGWSRDFCSFAACQPFLPAWPRCRLIIILGFAQVASSECIGPRPQKEPSCPALSEVPKVSGIFHSSSPAKCRC